MTLTPREIQEKQFHDAFRGYNHEEVDLFIDQVAEAYEQVYRENQNFNRRLEELQERAERAPEAAPAAARTPAPITSTSESEDMLKRMLVTAQETADKAVANARSKAQVLIEEAEIKARRIEEQADAVSSTTLQDAQRRARDLLQTAQQEEAELRDRIDGMRTFERDFRSRLGAFIRSQLELLETKPMVSGGPASPVSAPFFDRSKLLSETMDKFGSLPAKASAPPEPPADEDREAPDADSAGAGEPSASSDWLSEARSQDSAADAVTADEPPSWSGEPDADDAERTDAESVRAAVKPASSAGETGSGRKKTKPESKSIHELFWGED